MTFVSALLIAAGIMVAGSRPPQLRQLIGKITASNKKPRRRHYWPVRSRQEKSLNPAVVLSEVATRLRAGTAETVAWQQTLNRQNLLQSETKATKPRRKDSQTAKTQNQTEDGPARASEILERVDEKYRHQLQVESLQLCVKFCGRLGAPQAEVLEEISAGINQDAVATAEREVAMAAPRLSGRILTGLPIVGVLAMVVSGLLEPGWFLESPIGMAVGGLGLGLLATGTVWMNRLVKAARTR